MQGYLTKRKGFFRQIEKYPFFRSTVCKKKKGYRKVPKHLLSAITFVVISLSQTKFSGTLIWCKRFEQLSFLFLEQTQRNTSPNLSSALLYFSVLSKWNSSRTPGNILWTAVSMFSLWQRFGVFLSESQLGLSVMCQCFFLLLPSHWYCQKCSAKIGGWYLEIGVGKHMPFSLFPI